MSFQAYIDNIKAKTGKTPEEFKKLAEKEGLLQPGVKAGAIGGLVEAGFRFGTRPRHRDLRHVQRADEVTEPKSSSPWHLSVRGVPPSTTRRSSKRIEFGKEKEMLSAIGTELLATRAGEVSAGRIWIGWSISGLTAAFMLFDAGAKFAKPAQVIDAFARTGWPMRLSSTLGAILLTCTVFYLVPQTAVLGAILLTGYLGGAVATNLRIENPLLSHTLFPVYFGVLIWIGLWVRDPRLGSVFPLLR